MNSLASLLALVLGPFRSPKRICLPAAKQQLLSPIPFSVPWSWPPLYARKKLDTMPTSLPVRHPFAEVTCSELGVCHTSS